MPWRQSDRRDRCRSWLPHEPALVHEIVGARGLFVSYSGFSQDGLHAFTRGRPTSIVCMDGLDLTQILSGSLSLLEVIQRKKRRAVETGHAFVPVRDLFFSVT